jgi:hypothetical protein
VSTQLLLTLYWTISAFIGLTITSFNFRAAWKGVRKLKDVRKILPGKVDEGMMILATGQLWIHAIMIWMHLTFLIVGIFAGIPHERESLQSTVITVVVATIPTLLIVISSLTAFSRSRAAKIYSLIYVPPAS